MEENGIVFFSLEIHVYKEPGCKDILCTAETASIPQSIADLCAETRGDWNE